MRKVNINNKEEIKRFKSEISDWLFLEDYNPIPYRRDDSTEKGANYTLFIPRRWKPFITPERLRQEMRNEVDADKVTIEYIDFVRE